MITFLKLGRYGRLGNQMFQIAGTIGLATRFEYNFGFPEWINHDHGGRFKSREDIQIQKYFKHPLPALEVGDYPEHFIKWGYHDILHLPDHISLWGHFQCERYFTHCKDLLRHYFEIKRPAKFKDISISKNTIAIHVRLGDYDGAYHPRLDMKYYAPALEEFPAHYPLLVFSDEPNLARMYFGSEADYMEDNHYMEDLWMMNQCSHFIIGNSSFSWWPAWLGNHPGKIVVAPENWFGPACKASPVDIYAEGWKKI